MFDLEAQIKEWRAELAHTGLSAREVVEELESHLRERVARLSAGLPPAEAFAIAARELGDGKTLKREFHRAGGALRFWRNSPLELKLTAATLMLVGVNCLSQAARLCTLNFPFSSPAWVSIVMLVCLFMALQIVTGIGLLRHSRFWRFSALVFLSLDCFSSIWSMLHYVRYTTFESQHTYYIFMGTPVNIRYQCVTDILFLGMALFGFYVLTRPAIRNLFRPTFAG